MSSRRVPSAIASFAKSLRSTPPCVPVVSLGELRLFGNHAEIPRLNYNKDDFELIRGRHDYKLEVGGQPVEVSAQMYLNASNHYRMFLFSRCGKAKGMLFSINLTVSEEIGGLVWLGQKISFREGRNKGPIASKIRSSKTKMLADILVRSGIVVTDNLEVELGTYDSRRDMFLDTTPSGLIKTFITIGVVKGHFSGNKGYQFSCLPRFDDSFEWQWDQTKQVQAQLKPNRRGARGARSIPLALRYQVLERDRSCIRCGSGPHNGAILHVDHVMPFSAGGLTTLDNLQTLCADCNLGKGNRIFERRPAVT